MSSATAERFLRTQRKLRPHGISTTKAGTLLKHQIPIRTFAGWENTQPGFLEADLVAHCGGHAEGSYLYTLTLTDVATGWTECLPLLARTSDLVVKALERARTLFPFPILGLDTDNGSEFINKDLVAYCEREHMTFTRGRPEQKNDQCYVEERNRSLVRHVVGYNRLMGEQTYQQIVELYRALHLYVNCFQPSMKLLSKRQEENRVRSVYDPAKTPLQRLLLSGVLSASAQHELEEIAQALDPLGLAEQVEQLQHAVWCCAVPSPSFCSNAVSLLRFAVEPCLSEPVLINEDKQEAGATTDPQPAACTPFLNWRRSNTNPFASEWERLLAWVRAHPERSTSHLFEELQHLFPERYTLSQYPALQRAVRKIRAHLRKQEEPWPMEIIHGPGTNSPAPEQDSHQASHQGDGVPSIVLSSTSSSQAPANTPLFPRPVPIGEEEIGLLDMAIDPGGPCLLQPIEKHHQATHTSLPLASGSEAFTVLTIDLSVQSFLQERRTAGRKDKTLQWHQTALRSFQQHLAHHGKRFPQEIGTVEVRTWLAQVREEASYTGEQRSASTIQNYARSARAFCHWLVQQGYLERTP